MASPSPLGYDAGVDPSDRDAIRWRAWLAYHQLPYTDDGRLPPQRQLEKANELPNSTLTKLFRGRLIRPGPTVSRRTAAALRVDPDWLWEGKGSGPATVRGAPPLPKVRTKKVPVLSDGGREGSTVGLTFRDEPVIRRRPRKRDD